MKSPSHKPIDLQVRAARGRAEPVQFTLGAGDILTLAIEAMQLAKLVATEERDIMAIRADHALRSQRMADLHEEIMFLIEQEYQSRAQQVACIHEQVKLLIACDQFAIAQHIMDRLTDLLAVSPFELALRHRSGNSQA